MSFNAQTHEQRLLQTAAAEAVYDSLIQANVNLATVSLESVKQMLVAECQYRSSIGTHAMAMC